MLTHQDNDIQATGLPSSQMCFMQRLWVRCITADLVSTCASGQTVSRSRVAKNAFACSPSAPLKREAGAHTHLKLKLLLECTSSTLHVTMSLSCMLRTSLWSIPNTQNTHAGVMFFEEPKILSMHLLQETSKGRSDCFKGTCKHPS